MFCVGDVVFFNLGVVEVVVSVVEEIDVGGNLDFISDDGVGDYIFDGYDSYGCGVVFGVDGYC